jgi:SAM-dependent methyltransferase
MNTARVWNANLHYYPLLLNAVPRRARSVLDVGCGDGLLCVRLAEAGVQRVVGLDADADVLARARARHPGIPVEWVHGDVLSFASPEDQVFDAVLSVATLHHMDAAAGLARFAQLVRPGGVLAIVGLAANNWWDLPYAAIARFARFCIALKRGYWVHSAPMVWPPPATYRQMKRVASRILPGVHYKRHLLGRYSLVWQKPA